MEDIVRRIHKVGDIDKVFIKSQTLDNPFSVEDCAKRISFFKTKLKEQEEWLADRQKDATIKVISLTPEAEEKKKQRMAYYINSVLEVQEKISRLKEIIDIHETILALE